jgi:ADP-ribosylglycohydrolase
MGDASGTALEFTRPGHFTPIDDLVGGGPFRLKAGEWTDDTSMALCLAESLVTRGSFDSVDPMQRYCRWANEGHLSLTGRCFDIGATTAQALHRFERDRVPYAGSDDPNAAGNGSLMRLAPVALAYHDRPAAAVRHAGLSSRTTHAAPALSQRAPRGDRRPLRRFAVSHVRAAALPRLPVWRDVAARGHLAVYTHRRGALAGGPGDRNACGLVALQTALVQPGIVFHQDTPEAREARRARAEERKAPGWLRRADVFFGLLEALLVALLAWRVCQGPPPRRRRPRPRPGCPASRRVRRQGPWRPSADGHKSSLSGLSAASLPHYPF